MDASKSLIYGTIIFNSVIGLADRISQLVFCGKSYPFPVIFGGQKENIDSIKNACLTFCVLPTAIHFLMVLIYVTFHHEEILTTKLKIRFFFMYLLSSEALCPFGVHKSFKSKYSENSENVLVTLKVLNALHIMFVSIPQILIVSIYESARDDSSFKNSSGKAGIASLIFSLIFIVWSVGYYFVCQRNEDDYEAVISEVIK